MFDKVLKKGLRGIIEETEANIQRFIKDQESDIDKLYFWQSAVMVCE
jgi:hypothetical protein